MASSYVAASAQRERERDARRRLGRTSIIAAAAALTLALVPAALAGDRGTATAVLRSQLEFLDQQNALNRCLEASPTRNTPCTRRHSRKLAAMADRHIAMIRASIDGTEAPCVRTVARQQIAFLRIWRDGARALARNERKKAKRLFVSSLPISRAQGRLQPRCFTEVLGDG